MTKTITISQIITNLKYSTLEMSWVTMDSEHQVVDSGDLRTTLNDVMKDFEMDHDDYESGMYSTIDYITADDDVCQMFLVRGSDFYTYDNSKR